MKANTPSSWPLTTSTNSRLESMSSSRSSCGGKLSPCLLYTSTLTIKAENFSLPTTGAYVMTFQYIPRAEQSELSILSLIHI